MVHVTLRYSKIRFNVVKEFSKREKITVKKTDVYVFDTYIKCQKEKFCQHNLIWHDAKCFIRYFM